MARIEIPLTRGYVAIIDEEDWPLVSQYNWCTLIQPRRNSLYAIANVSKENGDRTTLRLHRLVMGALPGQQIDHRDRNGLHNWRSNLRACTQSQNLGNTGLQRNNTSGYKGVTWHKQRNKWAAQIKLHYKHRSLGLFTDPWEAAQAYNRAALSHWGEYASLNERQAGK